MNILARLFFEFFKIGLFAVGGGLATIPFLQELSEKTSWFNISQLADMIAISESTPGPLGVNVATYVGFSVSGVLGAVCATIGLVTPSIIIIVIIAKVLEKFRNNKIVDNAFFGLRAASTALITSAGLSVAIIALFSKNESGSISISNTNWYGLLLAILILFFSRWNKKTKKLHPIVFIVFSAILGIVFKM